LIGIYGASLNKNFFLSPLFLCLFLKKKISNYITVNGPLIGLAYDTPNIGPCGSFLLQHHPPVAFVIILGHVVHSIIPITISPTSCICNNFF